MLNSRWLNTAVLYFMLCKRETSTESFTQLTFLLYLIPAAFPVSYFGVLPSILGSEFGYAVKGFSCFLSAPSKLNNAT